MSKEIKFTTEELESLTDLQNKYQESQIKFGQISVQRLLLNQQLDKLFENEQQVKNEYSEVQQEEAKLVASLSEKYGNGQLDPETGVFTPNS